MMLTQDVPAVRNGQRCLELFGRLQYDQQRIKLLLNRYQKASKITVEVVAETLGQPLTHTISNDFISADRRHQPRRAARPTRRRARKITQDIEGLDPASARRSEGAAPAPPEPARNAVRRRRSPMGLRDRLKQEARADDRLVLATAPRTPTADAPQAAQLAGRRRSTPTTSSSTSCTRS